MSSESVGVVDRTFLPAVDLQSQCGNRVEQENGSDKKVAHVAKGLKCFVDEVHSAADSVSKTIKVCTNFKGVFAGLVIARATEDIADLGGGGKRSANRIWGVLFTAFTLSALELAQIIGENVPAAVPILNGVSVGAAGLSVFMATEALLREYKVSQVFENFRTEVSGAKGDDGKKAALLSVLKKQKTDDLESLQVQLGFKGVDLAKKINSLVYRLEMEEDGCAAVEEAEGMTNILADRVTKNFGVKIAHLAARVLVVAGMVLLVYAHNSVAKVVGVVMLCVSSVALFVLAVKRIVFANPNPFDRASKTLAHEAWSSLLQWYMTNLDPLFQRFSISNSGSTPILA